MSYTIDQQIIKHGDQYINQLINQSINKIFIVMKYNAVCYKHSEQIRTKSAQCSVQTSADFQIGLDLNLFPWLHISKCNP